MFDAPRQNNLRLRAGNPEQVLVVLNEKTCDYIYTIFYLWLWGTWLWTSRTSIYFDLWLSKNRCFFCPARMKHHEVVMSRTGLGSHLCSKSLRNHKWDSRGSLVWQVEEGDAAGFIAWWHFHRVCRHCSLSLSIQFWVYDWCVEVWRYVLQLWRVTFCAHHSLRRAWFICSWFCESVDAPWRAKPESPQARGIFANVWPRVNLKRWCWQTAEQWGWVEATITLRSTLHMKVQMIA